MAGDGAEIGLQHLPDDFLDDLDAPAPVSTPPEARQAHQAQPGPRLQDLELGAIQRALATHGGNVSATARALGVSRNTIYRKLPQTAP